MTQEQLEESLLKMGKFLDEYLTEEGKQFLLSQADTKANPLEPLSYASEAVPACGHCKYFILNTYEDEFKSEMGNCKYEVKFPDSTFARCAGTKKTMNKKDGRYCPCYESKPEA